MSDYPPILLLIFNRPENTAAVMEAIRFVRPERLYISADGPRLNCAEDLSSVSRTRQLVDSMIDWPCEVNRFYRDENLGCASAISGGIDWFFKHEEEGIILEDDCLPDETFFPFCREMLERYREEESVWSISGNNFHYCDKPYEVSYFFSKYFHCWGWATWKRAWYHYPKNLGNYYQTQKLSGLRMLSEDNTSFPAYWKLIAELCKHDYFDTWDYAFIFQSFQAKALHIHPSSNLVRNIGFGENSTHPHGSPPLFKNKPLRFPLSHPNHLHLNSKADALTNVLHYGISRKRVFKLRYILWKHLLIRRITKSWA